uniref:Uncharacterized protein n=1 Tax=Acrobeloides nanus TaxID=290746 RepID=A0A914E8X6_9BILA
MADQISDDPKYYCCCGKIHVKTVAVVIAWIRLALALFVIGSFILLKIGGLVDPEVAKQLENNDEMKEAFGGMYNVPILWYLPESVILVIISLLVIYGDRKKKAWAYIPTLVFEAIRLVISLIAIIFLIWIALLRDGSSASERKRVSSALTLLSFLVSITVLVLIFTLRAYQYMREITRNQSEINVEESKRLNVSNV